MSLTSNRTYVSDKFVDLQLDEHVIIEESSFENVEFHNCSFISTQFNKCTFDNCKFFSSTLSAVKFKDVNFDQVDFSKSKVLAIDWYRFDPEKPFKPIINFKSCDISDSNFSYLKLHDIKITNSKCHRVSFIATELSGSDLTKNDFEDTIFSKTDLQRCDLRHSLNYKIDPLHNKLKGAKFSLPDAINLLTYLGIEISEEGEE